MAGDEFRGIMTELGSMMAAVNTAQVVQAGVTAYDHFAGEAMLALLRNGGREIISLPKEVARFAWALADAMMLERAERGLGRFGAPEPVESPVGKSLTKEQFEDLKSELESQKKE